MLANLFKSEIYARIYRNRMALRLIRKNRNLEAIAEQPFTSHRLLVGDFTSAEKLLSWMVKKIVGSSWLPMMPSILIHPVEMVEGGLSQVEERLFQELGLGARGGKVKVYVGPELSDQAVIDKLAGR